MNNPRTLPPNQGPSISMSAILQGFWKNLTCDENSHVRSALFVNLGIFLSTIYIANTDFVHLLKPKAHSSLQGLRNPQFSFRKS